MSRRSISIVLTSHNGRPFIGEALASITAQTRPPEQVMVADDGSTDGTLEEIERWARDQSFEVVLRDPVRKAAGGPSVGRQWAIENSRTDLMALLDHDDLLLPNHLERLEAGFDAFPDLSICFGDARVFGEDPADGERFLSDKDVGSTVSEAPNGAKLLGGRLFQNLLYSSFIPTSSNLWRRDRAVAIAPMLEQALTADDQMLFLYLARQGGVAYFPEVVGCRRLHESNLSRDPLVMTMHSIQCARVLLGSNLLKLSQDEDAFLRERVERDLEAAAYFASKKGAVEYLSITRRLGAGVRLRGLAVSLLHSFRLLEPPPPRHPKNALGNH